MWETFQHNGIYYPSNYVQTKNYMLYDNKYIPLNLLAEMYAYLYFKVKDKYKDQTFNNNFFKSWKRYLPKDSIIKHFQLCNFSHFAKKHLPKSQEIPLRFKTCVIDGQNYPINYPCMEPACIFTGRGEHPLRGTIKPLILPEQVTLNLSTNASIPLCPLLGHNWGSIVHNNNANWIASWKDSLGNLKYIYPLCDNFIKTKFEFAQSLKQKLNTIRKKYNLLLDSECLKHKQLATAIWLVDHYCIRVGNEKPDDSADTVGCCTLRLEHVNCKDNILTLNFLGKDSIPCSKTIKLDPKVYKNILQFTKNKNKKDQLFDLIDAPMCNRYLHKLLPNLTAKVFRTCHASSKFCHLLHNANSKKEYILANKKIAKLCNHTNTTTSKNNYIDPRITFAFVRRHQLNIHNFFSESQLEKYKWALDTSFHFKF